MTAPLPLTADTDRPLKGLSILVTRPVKQAEFLLSKLQHYGANTRHQPCIVIKAAVNEHQADILESLNNYDCLIFISKNAVEYGFDLFDKAACSITAPAFAAIGKTTNEALLTRAGITAIQPEEGFDSEALLNCAEFSEQQISGKKLLIVRGGNGRDHLKKILEQRHALVDYIDVYRRYPANLILPLDDFKDLDIITVSSQEGLENLLSLLDATTQAEILNKRLITPSQRCSDRARDLGFKQIETAENATDDAMLSCILKSTKQATITNNTGC